jgi:hypothetical protein
MKTTITILYTLVIGIFATNAQTLQWARSIGGADRDQGHAIASDGYGNLFITGRFEGIVDFDTGEGISSMGESDIFISKLDEFGNFLWTKSLGGTSLDHGRSICVDGSGNIYTTGYFNGTVDFDPGVEISNLTSAAFDDVFISKLDTEGNFIWAKSFGGEDSDSGHSIAVDASGNVYTTGSFVETADFDPGVGTSTLVSAGMQDIYISKLDAEGNLLWAKGIGDTADDRGYSITLDGSENIYVSGWFEGMVDFDPGTGITNIMSAGGKDIYILKLDASGNFLWAKTFGGYYDDYGYSVVVDDSGKIYITGSFEGTADFNPNAETNNLMSAGWSDVFISKLDPAGNLLWAKRMGGNNGDWSNSIAVDASGNVYTTGFFMTTADFDPGEGTYNLISSGISDIFISKLDEAGNFLSAYGIGGPSPDSGYSIALDESGNVHITGLFSETVDFNPVEETGILTSVGDQDIFIIKLSGDDVGILDNSYGAHLMLYPNPTKGTFIIDLGKSYDVTTVKIRNIFGQDVLNKSFINSNILQLNIPGSAGVYFVEVNTGDKNAIIKVVKE